MGIRSPGSGDDSCLSLEGKGGGLSNRELSRLTKAQLIQKVIDISQELVRPDQPLGDDAAGRDDAPSQSGGSEAALWATGERYRTLVEESFDGIFIQKGTKIVFANRRLHDMLGHQPGALVGLDHWSVYSPEYQEITRSRAQARLRGEKPPARYEVKCQRTDGSSFDAEIFAGVISVEGSPGIQVWVRDITERKEADKALAASEERFRCLSQNAPDIIYALDSRGAFIYVNGSWQKILGHSENEVLGRYFVDFVPPEQAEDYIRIFKEIRDAKATIHITGTMLHKDGEVRYLDMSGAPNLDDQGRVTGMVGMLKDITEAMAADRARKVSEARLRVALQAAPDPVVIYDLQGRAEYVNPAFCQVFGWQPDELLGRRIDFVPEAERQRTMQAVQDVVSGKGVTDFETRRYTKDGQLVEVSISSASYSGEGDDRSYTIATLRDITEAKRARDALRASEASLARAQQMAQLGNWELDLSSGQLVCSEQARHIFGVSPDLHDITLGSFLSAVHADDRAYVENRLAEASQATQPLRIEHRIVHPGGRERIVLNLAEAELDPAGRPARLVGAVLDITERRRSEEQMILLARVFETTIEGILVTNADGVIEMINPAFTAITGFSAAEAVGQTPRILNSKRQGPEFYQEMWSRLKSQGSWQGEIWNRRKSGEAYPQWLTITAIKDSEDNVTHYVGVFHDITETKRSEERITYQAYHDALTGLPNRLLFNDRLTMAMAHAKRKEQGLAVLFLDLDHFKNINDSLGHAVGDLLLQKVAERLVRWSRDEDTVARIGGDEFIILLQGADDPDYAVYAARRILASLSRPFLVREHELYATASVGITLFPHDGQDTETLISNADLAMYRAKDDGRNNYKLFTPALNAKVVERMALEGHIRKALERGEFRLYYQPKVDLKTGRMVGVEALARWQRDIDDLVAPDQFIPVAEETGLIVPLGRWVLTTACRQAKRWHDQGFKDFQMSVNLSPRQFRQKDLVAMVRSTLDATGLPPDLLDLEITENVVMVSVDEATETLNQLAGLGVRLSMDDFGRGYSSLYHLKRFPMHALKIDRSFVMDVATDPEAASIVNTIISMSRTLGLKVVAEGVDDPRQLAFLKEHGCDQMQGYYFSRAVDHSEITRMLLSGKLLT